MVLGSLALYGLWLYLMVKGEDGSSVFYQSGSIAGLAQWLTFVHGLGAMFFSGMACYRTVLHCRPRAIILRILFIIFPCMLVSTALLYASLVFFAVV